MRKNLGGGISFRFQRLATRVLLSLLDGSFVPGYAIHSDPQLEHSSVSPLAPLDIEFPAITDASGKPLFTGLYSGPYFDLSRMPTNVTAQVGGPAFLPCKVKQVGNRAVSLKSKYTTRKITKKHVHLPVLCRRFLNSSQDGRRACSLSRLLTDHSKRVASQYYIEGGSLSTRRDLLLTSLPWPCMKKVETVPPMKRNLPMALSNIAIGKRGNRI